MILLVLLDTWLAHFADVALEVFRRVYFRNRGRILYLRLFDCLELGNGGARHLRLHKLSHFLEDRVFLWIVDYAGEALRMHQRVSVVLSNGRVPEGAR